MSSQEDRWSYPGGILQGKVELSQGNPLIPQALEMFNLFYAYLFICKKEEEKTKQTNDRSPAGWSETRGRPGNKSELLVRSDESPG